MVSSRRLSNSRDPHAALEILITNRCPQFRQTYSSFSFNPTANRASEHCGHCTNQRRSVSIHPRARFFPRSAAGI